MDKKLQIFISSTYTDLIEERQAVVETILQCGHIPAGMELFSANNKKQFDVIKKWIRNSDLVILILGGKYGSLEQERNKSYIQLEYEYAKHIGKTPIVLCLTEEGIANKIKKGLYDFKSPEYLNTQYIEFKSMILKSKLCAFFSDINELKIKVMSVVTEQEKEMINKRMGWVRINELSNILEGRPERICEYDEQGYEYKDLKNGTYTNNILICSNVNELRYYSSCYNWVYGGNIVFESYYKTQTLVDVYRENLNYVVTNRFNQVVKFGDSIQTGVIAEISDCDPLYHMHLHYRFTNNSTWKHVKMWVKIPEGYYFKNVTYSILDSLNPANPIYQKVINCADKRYVEKNIKYDIIPLIFCIKNVLNLNL